MVEDLNLFFPTARASNPEKMNEALLLMQVTLLAKALLRVVYYLEDASGVALFSDEELHMIKDIIRVYTDFVEDVRDVPESNKEIPS